MLHICIYCVRLVLSVCIDNASALFHEYEDSNMTAHQKA